MSDQGRADGADGADIAVIERLRRVHPGPPEIVSLAEASFTVRSGDYIAITGRSGAGKSTLLNQLGLLDVPTSGGYRLLDVDTTELTAAQRADLRATALGFIFQSFELLPERTAIENVMLGLRYQRVARRRRRADAQLALERVGLSHRSSALPGRLSGGERQRVAIARAIVGAPALLLCDEPTGNLDSSTSDEVMALFDALNRAGTTLVVVTHDPGVAGRARRRLVVADGVVTEQAC